MDGIYVLTLHHAAWYNVPDDGYDITFDKPIEAFRSLEDAINALREIYERELNNDKNSTVRFLENDEFSEVYIEPEELSWGDNEYDRYNLDFIELH